jgi:HEAT repeat protein
MFVNPFRMKGFGFALIALSAMQPCVAAAATNLEPVRVVDSLLAEMYAQPRFYYRWVLSSPGLRQNLPGLAHRAGRAETQVWMNSGGAARKLAGLGTNAWPAIPVLVDGVIERPPLAMRAISVLVEIDADKHPDWNNFARRWRGDAGVATKLSYLLFTKNEFGQTYEARHRRFALLGLALVGPAAQPQMQHLIGVLKSDDDHPLWPLAATALTNAKVDRSLFVPLFAASLRDSNKHPYTRASAAAALGEVMPATEETLSVLREALQNEFAVVRLAAVRSLWRLEGRAEELVPIVEALLSHKLRTVRVGALKLVSEMGVAAQPLARAVEERLADEDEEVRRTARQALEAIERKGSQ